MLALSLAECIHQLLQGCGSLDLEEDFVVVVGDLDVEVLDRGGSCFLLGRHFESLVDVESQNHRRLANARRGAGRLPSLGVDHETK